MIAVSMLRYPAMTAALSSSAWVMASSPGRSPGGPVSLCGDGG